MVDNPFLENVICYRLSVSWRILITAGHCPINLVVKVYWYKVVVLQRAAVELSQIRLITGLITCTC